MLTGNIKFDSDRTPAELASHLAECLRHVHARQVVVDGNRVTFRGGMFRLVSNWNVLVAFGSGEIRVDPENRQIKYRLNVTQLIVVVTIMMSIMALVMFSSSIPAAERQLPKIIFSVIILIGWIWLVGGNLVIGIVRFTSFLRRSLSEAP